MTVTHGNQPLITGRRIFNGNFLDSDDALADFPASRLTDGITSWQAGFATGTGEAIYDCGQSVSARMLSIVRHNLAEVSATLSVHYSAVGVGGPWTSFASITPTDNSPAGVLAAEVTARYWRVTVTGHTATAYIGDLTVS